MTRRGTGLLVASLGAFLVARTFGIPEVQIAALAGLLLLVGAFVLVWTAAARLEVDRTVTPGTVWFDGQATVNLSIRNVGPLPSAPVQLVDEIPTGFGERPRARLDALAPGGRATVSYRLTGAQRGTAQLGPLRARLTDPFGLVARSVTLPSTGELTVYPPVLRLPPGLPLGGASSSGSDGRRRLTVDGEDLADVREYVHGDDLRSVHWPSTAHRGRLMVRQNESARSPRAVLVLDVRSDRHTGSGPAGSIETAVTAAASAAYHLATRGRSTVLVEEPLTSAPRALPWELLLGRLADVETRTVDLTAALQQVGQGMAGDGAMVAVVTTPDAAELRQLARAGRGFTTRVAIVVDTASHGRGKPDPAAGTAAEALRAAGFRAVVLRRGDRIDVRWRDLLVRPRPASTAVGT